MLTGTGGLYEVNKAMLSRLSPDLATLLGSWYLQIATCILSAGRLPLCDGSFLERSIERWGTKVSSHFSKPISVEEYICGCRAARIEVGACRALAQLFEQVDVRSLRPHLASMFATLAKFFEDSLISQTVRSPREDHFALATCCEVLTVWNMNFT